MPKQEPRISPETQYKEEYENWRQHDRFIWQTPSIIIALDAAAVVASWAAKEIPWWAWEFIIAFGFIFTVVLTFALIKHRYFIDLQQETLLALEKEHAQKCIQRMSEPREHTAYWAKKHDPTPLEKFSAHRLLKYGMYLVCLLMLALLFFNWLIYNPNTPACLKWPPIGVCVAGVLVAFFFLWKNRAL